MKNDRRSEKEGSGKRAKKSRCNDRSWDPDYIAKEGMEDGVERLEEMGMAGGLIMVIMMKMI